jgi:GNAT superfamily N-acetyltransferase
MHVRLSTASLEDVPALVVLRNAVSVHLTSEYGVGPWTGETTERGIIFAMRTSVVYVVRSGEQIIASLCLSTRKPWAVNKKYFTETENPLYLTSMVVHPFEQGKGTGRQCIEEARRVAKNWPADAIRLDAWDASAGAGDFYHKCGFREVGRVTYRDVPLIYFELLL